MDSNRDDAQRCLELAANALESGDIAKASRLLDKSRRMYPIPSIQDRLSAAIRLAKVTSTSQPFSKRAASAPSSPSENDDGDDDDDDNNPNHNSHSKSTSSSRPATSEMTAAARRVLQNRHKSHYDILDVGRDANETEIKRAYRQLALRLHPDRNFATGADEAFKRVSQAFMTLSDKSRRKHYDTFGSDDTADEVRTRSQSCRRQCTRDNMFERSFHWGGHFDPFAQFGHGQAEDLFTRAENFQFMANNTGPSAEEIQRRRHEQKENYERLTVFQRLRPILVPAIIMGIATLLSSQVNWEDGANSISYSMRQTRSFPVPWTTRNGVNFYTKADVSLSAEEKQRVWYTVDRRALAYLRSSCEEEEEQETYYRKEANSWLRTAYTRDVYRKKLEKFHKFNCAEFEELRSLIRRYG